MRDRINETVHFGIAVLLTAAIVIAVPGMVRAGETLALPDGSRLDLSHKCPVCGMVVGGKDGQGVTVTFKEGRVATFGGVAAAVFKDGHTVGFEGARCLFIYNSVPQKYQVNIKDVSRQFVTDFTSKKLIDLNEAYLVLGSDVKGPMGYDLIPFASKEAAGKFAAENNGKWIVQLHEIPSEKATRKESKPDAGDRIAPLRKDKTEKAEAAPSRKRERKAVRKRPESADRTEAGDVVPSETGTEAQDTIAEEDPTSPGSAFPEPPFFPGGRGGVGGHHGGMGMHR